MVDLFNTVANADGVTKNPDILEGNTVRSFLDKSKGGGGPVVLGCGCGEGLNGAAPGFALLSTSFSPAHSEEMRFLFVLSSVAKNEKILTAELHLFRLWPRVTDGPKRHHFCQVSVYQVLEKDKPDTPGGKKLLAARLVSLQTSGWEVFAITPAEVLVLAPATVSSVLQPRSNPFPWHTECGLKGVPVQDVLLLAWDLPVGTLVPVLVHGDSGLVLQVRDWTEDESSNQGLLVTVQGLGGSPLDPPPLQFASGRSHHESKKPMLVLFTDDGRRGASLPTAGFPDLKPQAPDLPAKMPVPKLGRTRSTRSLDRLQPCQRHPLSVDFEEIGWSGWIISPRGYNAFHCKGSCPFPLGENMRPTNHATVQSIINALKLSEGVSSPCCVPDKLYSINLLYFDDDENVVLKQYDDMVAGSCGCH
ncbi:hypothetical protein DV515_00015237 [Chloebia gouldiae]|uniref:TGF-beta family profile domain-containing protein n=1 Tax=Chloebia gouldiae TaxID=44316 RepID=A0A3L8RXF3_CHLGU|nr:hypothetical protein DV515_00015237 [Chloebia gouldiae]